MCSQEVIQLTQDLIGQKQTTVEDDAAQGTSAVTAETSHLPVRNWSPGEKCLAMFSEDKT